MLPNKQTLVFLTTYLICSSVSGLRKLELRPKERQGLAVNNLRPRGSSNPCEFLRIF